jgi:hypothetical protein
LKINLHNHSTFSDGALPPDGADHEAHEIVLALAVDAWQLRGLAPDERAPRLPRAGRAPDSGLGHRKSGKKSPGERELIEGKILAFLNGGGKFLCNRVAISTGFTFQITKKLLQKLVAEGKAKTSEKLYWRKKL